MSRCRACDKVLSEFELTRKVVSRDGVVSYPDYCNECFSSSGLEDVATVVSRSDLQESVVEEEPDYVFEE